MKSIEQIPPVVVALDVETIEEERNIVQALDDFSREDIALQVRQGRMDSPHFRELIQDGWFVIAGNRFDDAPAKMAIDIHYALRAEDEEHTPRPLPHAITVRPPRTSDVSELTVIRNCIDTIQKLKVPRHGDNPRDDKTMELSVIGTAQPELFHRSDNEHIGDQAYLNAKRARAIDIQGFEVVFNGLRGYVDNGGPGIVLASKLSLSELSLQDAAHEAYKLGAKSIILGDSVVKSPQPAVIIRNILDTR